MQVRIEYRRLRSNGEPQAWSSLIEYPEDSHPYDTPEALSVAVYSYFNSHASQSKDYQCRAMIYEGDEEIKLLGFYKAWRGAIASHPSNDCGDIPYQWDGHFTPKHTGDLVHMIKVGVRRVGGKLMLLVNAKEFHDQLDEIGCTFTGNRYNDRPATSNTVASSTHALSTDVLLTRDYKDIEVTESKKTDAGVEKVVHKVPVTAAFDLGSVWTTPPSFDQLKKLCNSANDAARKILEHYQPVDICVEIHKKVVK